MSNYTFENLIFSSLDEINDQGFLLWILHADKVPPHIGVSLDGKFYSLKANGRDNGIEINSIKNIITRKKITTILIELNESLIKENIEFCFRQFEKTISHEITCLDPIKMTVGCNNAEKLVELLNWMELNNNIISVLGINADNFEGIVDYDVKEIHARLEKLENAK